MAGQNRYIHEGAAGWKLKQGKPEGMREEREILYKTSSSEEFVWQGWGLSYCLLVWDNQIKFILIKCSSHPVTDQETWRCAACNQNDTLIYVLLI